MCLCDSECVSSSHSKSYQWVYDNVSPPKNHNCVCVNSHPVDITCLLSVYALST